VTFPNSMSLSPAQDSGCWSREILRRRSSARRLRYPRKVVVLFPIALVWLIAVIVWVVRNEVTPEQDTARRWTRLRPRPPRSPRRGRPNGSRPRRGETRASSSTERARR
jgi:hypothetical protein